MFCSEKANDQQPVEFKMWTFCQHTVHIHLSKTYQKRKYMSVQGHAHFKYERQTLSLCCFITKDIPVCFWFSFNLCFLFCFLFWFWLWILLFFILIVIQIWIQIQTLILILILFSPSSSGFYFIFIFFITILFWFDSDSNSNYFF